MRNAGSTYAKIGEYLGVTRERARQIVASAENRLGRLLIDTSLADLVAETTALIHKREESNK
jgi:DNA-directed RNA polymerase sigma subunit (sigma70/sigma32)